MEKIKMKDLKVQDIFCTVKEYSKRISRKVLIIGEANLYCRNSDNSTRKTKIKDELVLLLRNEEFNPADLNAIARDRY